MDPLNTDTLNLSETSHEEFFRKSLFFLHLVLIFLVRFLVRKLHLLLNVFFPTLFQDPITPVLS